MPNISKIILAPFYVLATIFYATIVIIGVIALTIGYAMLYATMISIPYSLCGVNPSVGPGVTVVSFILAFFTVSCVKDMPNVRIAKPEAWYWLFGEPNSARAEKEALQDEPY